MSQLELAPELLANEVVRSPTKTVTPNEQMEGKIANIVGTVEEHEETLRVYTI